MKNFINKWFHGTIVESDATKLKNLRELRATVHCNGVRVYDDLLSEVLWAKMKNGYRPKFLSISKTVYP